MKVSLGVLDSIEPPKVVTSDGKYIVISCLRGGVFLRELKWLVFIMIFLPRRSRDEKRMMKMRPFSSSKNRTETQARILLFASNIKGGDERRAT